MKIQENKNLGKSLFIAMIFAFFAPGCDYSYFDAEQFPDYVYSPVVAIPLAHSSLTFTDIVMEEDNDAVFFDDQNMVIMVYKDQMYSSFGNEMLTLPDQDFQKSFMIGDFDKTTQYVFTEPFILQSTEEEKLDSLTFDYGRMLFEVFSPQLIADGYGLQVEVTFPESRDAAGQPLSFVTSIGQQANENLHGYTMSLYSDAEGDNQVTIVYTLTVTGEGTPENAPYQVDLFHYLVDMEFERMFGFFGQKTFSLGEGKIPTNLFKNLSGGTIHFADPSIILKAANAFGFPIGIDFKEFAAHSKDGIYPITGFQNPFLIDGPSLQQVGQTVSSELILTANNSNINEVISTYPRFFLYNLDAHINPNSPEDNFIISQSELSIEMEIELPMHGSFSGISLTDTVDIAFNESYDEIEWVELNFDIINGFPLEAELQVHLLDDNGQLLLEVFGDTDFERVIESGILNSEGVITEPSHKNTKVKFNKQEAELLFNTRRIVLSSRMSTNDQGEQDVKIFSDYAIDISLGARIKAKSLVSF